MDRGLILDKYKGFFAMCWGFFQLGIFSNENSVDRVHGSWIGWRGLGPWWNEVMRQCLVGVRHTGMRARRCSPVVMEEDELDEVVLKGCSPKHERQRRGGAMEVKIRGGLSST
jgi:hypothetical protein